MRMGEAAVKDRCRSMALAALLWTGVSAAEPPALRTDGSTQILWQRVFASKGDDWINEMMPLRDGSVMAVGFLDRVDGGDSDWRALAVQLDRDGKLLARHEYGAGGGIDAFWNVIESRDGRLAFSGFTTRIGAGGIDAWALLADAQGRMTADKSFGGTGYDRFTDHVMTADGGYLWVGHTQDPGSAPRHMLIVKTEADGNEQWRRTGSGSKADPLLYIEPSGDGGFIVAGGYEDDMLVMKIDAAGKEVWRQTIGTPGRVDNDHGLVVLPDGKIVVVGYTESWGAGSNDLFAATLSPSGAIQRIETFGGSADDRAILAKADPKGRVWIVGYTKSASFGGWDIIVTRLDRGGGFAGNATIIGSAQDDNGTAVLPLRDGSLLIGGYSRSLGAGGEDAFVARISAPEWRGKSSFLKINRVR